MGLGGADGNQTHDLFIANEALYQLSYCPPSYLNERILCGGAGLRVNINLSSASQ